MSTADVIRGMRSLSGCDPRSYHSHRLHGRQRSYPATNCYADLLIELLHACGYEPMAMFGHLVRLDFEGDQWTFFKPPPDDLEALYGIDIHEMQPYRPLPLQIAEQLEHGRTLIVELDSWWLPDTATATDRREHVKTSAAPDAIDLDAEQLRYFHNGALYELGGEDYRGVFRLGGHADEVLPPYTELVRFDAGPRLDGEALRQASLATLAAHLRHTPAGNPFERFQARLTEDLPALLDGDMDAFHAYAFATSRMAGAGFEVLASYCEWLLGESGAAAASFTEIVEACKALSFRLARRRLFDPEALTTSMARAWEQGIATLHAAID